MFLTEKDSLCKCRTKIASVMQKAVCLRNFEYKYKTRGVPKLEAPL